MNDPFNVSKMVVPRKGKLKPLKTAKATAVNTAHKANALAYGPSPFVTPNTLALKAIR